MKKRLTFVLCLTVWLSFTIAVFGGDGPPIQPPPLQPPPVLPFDADGAKPFPEDGKTLRMKPPKKEGMPMTEKKPEAKRQKAYVIIGMYDRMLGIAQHKRSWPLDDPINGCVTFHDIGQVCQ